MKIYIIPFFLLSLTESTLYLYCRQTPTKLGLVPQNLIDRACQIHKICSASSYPSTSCFCNLQFYNNLATLHPAGINSGSGQNLVPELNDMRNSLMHEVQSSLHNCNFNTADITQKHFIGNCPTLPCNAQGFTYFPIFSTSPLSPDLTAIHITDRKNVRIYLVDRYERFSPDFGYLARDNPSDLIDRLDSGIYEDITDRIDTDPLSLSSYISVPYQKVLLFVNSDPYQSSYVSFEKITASVIGLYKCSESVRNLQTSLKQSDALLEVCLTNNSHSKTYGDIISGLNKEITELRNTSLLGVSENKRLANELYEMKKDIPIAKTELDTQIKFKNELQEMLNKSEIFNSVLKAKLQEMALSITNLDKLLNECEEMRNAQLIDFQNKVLVLSQSNTLLQYKLNEFIGNSEPQKKSLEKQLQESQGDLKHYKAWALICTALAALLTVLSIILLVCLCRKKSTREYIRVVEMTPPDPTPA